MRHVRDSSLNKPQQFEFARHSAGSAPLRRPGSVRRTTSIDSDWPEGNGKPWEMIGRARDLLTPADGREPVELAVAGFRILASPKREILSISANPDHPRLQALVGVRAGGASRAALNQELGDVRGTPLFQLVDDYAGASLVAAWIWSRWTDDWMRQQGPGPHDLSEDWAARMRNVCVGFQEGASSLGSDGQSVKFNASTSEVGPLENPDDPMGWHAMPHQQGPQKRRARRIDVWRDGDVVRVDAGFQDSGSNPGGGRTAIHEYRVHAEVDAASNRLLALQALPLILPYRECPAASIKATRMIGQDVTTFRDTVLETLPQTLGCTHLNDVLRALADVPVLASRLAD